MELPAATRYRPILGTRRRLSSRHVPATLTLRSKLRSNVTHANLNPNDVHCLDLHFLPVGNSSDCSWQLHMLDIHSKLGTWRLVRVLIVSSAVFFSRAVFFAIVVCRHHRPARSGHKQMSHTLGQHASTLAVSAHLP